jgi:nucleoside-diphosphate-sugar epimerase
MEVLVTGANGHIGANVVRELIDQGHEPVCYVRKTSNLAGLDGLAISLHKSNLDEVGKIEEAMKGFDEAIHLTASYKLVIDNPKAVIEPGIIGTINVLEMAKLTPG